MAYFNKEAKCNTKKCAFFSYAKNSVFGVGLDALISPDLLIEIKTRAAGSDGPLEDLRKNSSYFIQTQLQMACTGTKNCIIMSYHPEYTSANYFLVTQHNLLWDITEFVINSICYKTLSKNGHREKI